MKFEAKADVREINRYSFQIEADSEEEAKQKLTKYLEEHCPYPYHNDGDGIRCTDVETAWETEEVKEIKIK